MSDYTPTMAELKDYATSYSAIASEAEWDRALVAHDAAKRAEWEAEQGETEWEFSWSGTDDEGDDWVMDDTFDTRDSAEAYTRRPIGGWVLTDHGELVRRRKAGPWMPVPDTTGDESEGKA